MAIRIRTVNGVRVALCAAESDPMPGDIYLDDAAHGALSAKFARDWADAPHPSVFTYPSVWAAMDSQKLRDADEEFAKWEAAGRPDYVAEPSDRYLTATEKERELGAWALDECADPGVHPFMARLNAIDGVCTVQCCVGHLRKVYSDGSHHIENGHVEMRLDVDALRRFYDGMPRLRGLPGVDDVAISWRTPYQVCNVWFAPGLMPQVVDLLESVLSDENEATPKPEAASHEGASPC